MIAPFAIPWPVHTCAICLLPIQGRPATIDPCGHTFCLGCIREWRTLRNQCATCRGECHGLVDIPDLLSRQLRRARENDAKRAATFYSENTTIILTPMDSRLCVFFPEELPNATQRIYYSFRCLDARKIYFLPLVQQETLWALPENVHYVSGSGNFDADLNPDLEVENYNYSEQDD